MKISDLQVAVSDFEKVVKSFGLLDCAGNIAVAPLCELYLTKSARSVQACVDALSEVKFESTSDQDVQTIDFFRPLSLPSQDVVHRAAQKLIVAVSSGDRDESLIALEDMGVAVRCQTPAQQLSRLEFCVRGARGRAQMISLVELSLFAVELGDYDRAKKYAEQAQSLRPGASELHDLLAVQGIVALSEGNLVKAICYLRESINVCLTDEYASLSCSVRAPNVMLAENLLDRGEREEVEEYLLKCQDVWEHQRKELATWVGTIRNGERPEFLASGNLGVMNHPSARIVHLCASARFPEGSGLPISRKSIAEVKAGREKLRTEYKAGGPGLTKQ